MEKNKDYIITMLIKYAEESLAVSGPEKKAWVVSKVVELVESMDEKLPVVGRYMDTSIVDSAEKSIIESLVQSVFERIKSGK